MSSKNCEPDFHELNERIITLSEEIPQNFIELAQRLKVMRDEKIYRSAAHQDFTAYLYSLDDKTGKMDRSTVYDLIGIYEMFRQVLKEPKYKNPMKEIGWSKLRSLCRYLRSYSQIVEDALGSFSDFRVDLDALMALGLRESKRNIEKDLQELKEVYDAASTPNYLDMRGKLPTCLGESKLSTCLGIRYECCDCPKCLVSGNVEEQTRTLQEIFLGESGPPINSSWGYFSIPSMATIVKVDDDV